jgi:predicted membrane-bound mannosyltransferase
MNRAVAGHDSGTDVVVYYGESGGQYDEVNAYVGPNREDWGESWWNTRPTCLMWYNSLPLPWYFASGEMDVTCENDRTNLGALARETQPPVIITQEFDTTVPTARLETNGYTGDTYRMRTSGSRNRFTVWTHEDGADNTTTR